MRVRDRISIAYDAGAEAGDRDAATIIAVGDAETWRGIAGPARSGPVAFLGFEEIDAELIRETGPGLVVSPLVSRRFDCVDLARRLFELGFPGRYRAIGDSVPSPDLIVREIRSMTPGLDFDIASLDAAFGPLG